MVSIESKHTLLAIDSYFYFQIYETKYFNSSRRFTTGLFGRPNGGKVKGKGFYCFNFKQIICCYIFNSGAGKSTLLNALAYRCPRKFFNDFSLC